jgi:ribonuclease-3
VIDALPGIDYQFSNRSLLQQALTHRSVGRSNYERLEFLGDSILNMVVSSLLYETYPDASEGDLSRMRARIVRGKTLSDLSVGLALGRHLKLGEGEMKSGGSRRSSILADALEAVLGAIYLDGGFEACRNVISAICLPLISRLPPVEDLKDPKTLLQEWLQARGRALPVYELVGEEGVAHARKFQVKCSLFDASPHVLASGTSVRKAEQAAAASLLSELRGNGETV